MPQFPVRLVQSKEPTTPAPYRTPRRIAGKDVPYQPTSPVREQKVWSEQGLPVEEYLAAQDAIELSAMRLQAEEALNAGMRAYQETNDPTVLDQAKKAAQVIQSKNPRIQTAYSASYQGMETALNENVAAHVHAVKMKQVDALADQNIQKAIEGGNIEEAAKQYVHLITLHPENKVQYEQAIAELPSTIPLMQAANLIRSENPADVVRGTGILGGIKREGLRTELVAQLDTLLDQAKAQTTYFQGQNYDALAVEIDKVAADTSLSPAEVFSATAALRSKADAQIRSGEIDGTKGKVALNALKTLDNMAKVAAKPQPDMKIQAEFYDRLDRTQSEQDFKDLREWMRGNVEAFGSTYDQRVKELYDRKGKGAYEAITASVNLTLGTDPLQERGPFLKYVHDVISEKEKANGGKKLTDEEIHILVPTVYVSWRANRDKEVFTQAKVQGTIGKVLAGNVPNAVIKFKPTYWESIGFLESELGPSWATHAPGVIKVLADKYSAPMWDAVPENQKTELINDMVKRARGWNDNPPDGGWDNADLDKAQEIFGDPAVLSQENRTAWDEYVTEKYPSSAGAFPATTTPVLPPIAAPKEYPDAVWDEARQMWTIIRDGRLKGVIP